MHWWQILTVKLERERGFDQSDLLRELNVWISTWWEEVFESETVDDMGEDGVVRPPLASHTNLTAPVPAKKLQLFTRNTSTWGSSWGTTSGTSNLWKVPEVVGEVEEGKENAVSLPCCLPRNPRVVVRGWSLNMLMMILELRIILFWTCAHGDNHHKSSKEAKDVL